MVIATVLRITYQIFVTMRAGRVLHDKLTSRVLFATMAWFESTPSGRLINRFSNDISTIDTSVMNRLQDFFETLTGTVQVIIVIALNLPIMLLGMGPVVMYFWFISKQYLRVSRDLKRLESVNKSPVFVLFSETIGGLSTIRAFQSEERFFDICCKYVDNMNRCNFYMWVSNRWLNFRLMLTGAIVQGGAAYFVVQESDAIGVTIAGLVLIYAFSFTQNLTFLTRSYSDCQMNMNSVERVLEYCKIDQEKYLPTNSVHEESGRIWKTANKEEHDTESNTVSDMSGNNNELDRSSHPILQRTSVTPYSRNPRDDVNSMVTSRLVPFNWPVSGEVRFEDISMRYRDSTPCVLK